jgi:hypothetical protein
MMQPPTITTGKGNASRSSRKQNITVVYSKQLHTSKYTETKVNLRGLVWIIAGFRAAISDRLAQVTLANE